MTDLLALATLVVLAFTAAALVGVALELRRPR